MYSATIQVSNVNEALPAGLSLLSQRGVPAESRGMKTLRVPGPVSTIYHKPRERVLFDPIRNANPFFHLIEAMWILSGSEHSALPCAFLGTLARYSDDGSTFHGAYGYRLRNAFGFDQIETAASTLCRTPNSRQVVMSIWKPEIDLGSTSKDVPCNDMIMLDVVDGALNMTVCNRSNDVIWGAYGANVVQFSILQEYIATLIGVHVGKYVQQSNNYHVYTDNPFWLQFKQGEYEHGDRYNPYSLNQVTPRALAVNAMDAHLLHMDCMALDNAAIEGKRMDHVGFRSSFGRDVLLPVIRAYTEYKARNWDHALRYLEDVAAEDWRLAMVRWVNRIRDSKGQA